MFLIYIWLYSYSSPLTLDCPFKLTSHLRYSELLRLIESCTTFNCYPTMRKWILKVILRTRETAQLVVIAAQTWDTSSVPWPHIKNKEGCDSIICNPGAGKGEDSYVPGLPVSLLGLLANSRPTRGPDGWLMRNDTWGGPLASIHTNAWACTCNYTDERKVF